MKVRRGEIFHSLSADYSLLIMAIIKFRIEFYAFPKFRWDTKFLISNFNIFRIAIICLLGYL